jgi:hypothetical protein
LNEHRARRLTQMDHAFAMKFIPDRYFQHQLLATLAASIINSCPLKVR